MLQMLKKWIRKMFSNVHSAIVALIVVAIITALGGIVVFSKNLTLFLYNVLKSATPLWATILLILISCFLTYRRSARQNQAQLSLSRTDTRDNRLLRTLDDTDIKLLRVIAANEDPFDKDGLYTVNEHFLSESLRLSSQELKYRLEKLHKANCILYDPYGDLSGLTSLGREFLKEKNMLP